MQNTIKKSQLRTLVKVLLEDKTLGPSMIKVNPVVDPLAAVTDPANLDYKPRSRQELSIALNTLVDDIIDDNVPAVYDLIRNAIDNYEDEREKKIMKKNNSKIEETVRFFIRKILNENSEIFKEFYEKDPATGKMVWKGKGPAPKLAADTDVQKLDQTARGVKVGPQSPAGQSLKSTFKKMKDSDFSTFDASKPEAGRTRRNKMQDGDSLDKLAKEFGFKNPNGVLQFINRVMERFRYNWENYDDVSVAMLEILKNYITDISSSADLAPADVQMLIDHPEHVMDLETFRVYSKKKLKEKGLMP